MEQVIQKERLGDWIAALNDWEVHAPGQEDEVWKFMPVSSEVKLDHPNTTQPPKSYTFPQREVFFSFEQLPGEAPKLTPILPEAKKHALFGVRPCDGRANPRMDKVFTDQFEDAYYLTRRKGVAYVGLACNKPPSGNCFCLSVGGSPVSTEGLDVLMTDLGDRYFVTGLTETGKALMKVAGDVLGKASAADQEKMKKVQAEAVAHPQRAVKDVANVPAKMLANFDSPLWKELAKPCIGCGICTFLCPTCHCFDINDEVTGTVPLKGNRVRTWDNCQYPDFTMHSSGHNPREDTGARLRQRVSHKFRYFHENFGMLQCIGCGRCVSDCPVGIDIVAVVNKVAENAG